MPARPPPDLRTELGRLARLRHLQGALPPVLRGAPALALAAGALTARLAGAARNPVEDRLLGPVGTIELAPPPPSPPKKPAAGEPPCAPRPETTTPRPPRPRLPPSGSGAEEPSPRRAGAVKTAGRRKAWGRGKREDVATSSGRGAVKEKVADAGVLSRAVGIGRPT